MEKREQIIQRIANLNAEQFELFLKLYSNYEQLPEYYKHVTNGFVKEIAERTAKTA